MFIYEALSQDFATADEATRAVEAAGSGCVVKFRLDPNLPGRLPEFVHRSCAMWSFDGGHWYARSIFDGLSQRLCEERPC